MSEKHVYQVVFSYLRPFTDALLVRASSAENAESHIATTFKDAPGLDILRVEIANPDIVKSIDEDNIH